MTTICGVKPVRVALVVRWPTGGIRTYLKYVYGSLPAGKYKPLVIAPPGTETEMLMQNLGNLGATLEPIPVQRGGQFALALYRTLFRNRIDLVHSHGFTSAAFASFFCRLARRPHVATIHDVLTDDARLRLGSLRVYALRHVLELCDVVNAVGLDAAENLRQNLLSRWYAEHNLKTICNGIDTHQFDNVKPMDFQSTISIPKKSFVIGFFGRFMNQKGFRLLTNAVAMLRDRNLPQTIVVVAFGSDGYLREEQEEIGRLGLERHFFFRPILENPASAMMAVDCIVMPSRWEAFALLAAESLCLGTPLIASDCIGLREVVAGSPARICSAGSTESLANAITDELLDHESKSRAQEYRSVARTRFDVRITAKFLDELFDQVLATRATVS